MKDRALHRRLTDMGFVLVRSKKHAVYRHPQAGTLVAARTASDHRAAKNALAQARRRMRAAA